MFEKKILNFWVRFDVFQYTYNFFYKSNFNINGKKIKYVQL